MNERTINFSTKTRFVNPLVILEVPGQLEALRTCVTLKWFLSGVATKVNLQGGVGCESHSAGRTAERFVAVMRCERVLLQL